MNIACIGNMNNMLFQIGRYLKDDGHKVTFFLLEEFEHFLPEADSFENITEYKIEHLRWNFETFIKVTAKEIKNIFSSFDYLIGTDVAPAYLFKAGIKLDVYIPHGSDLYEYPFFKYRNFPPQLWQIPTNLISRAQFLGIKEADNVALDNSDEVYEIPYSKIRSKIQSRITSPPFLYFTQYNNNYQCLSVYYDKFVELRDKYKFIVFQQISQDWSMRGPYKIDKGNNNLINGFANYLKKDMSYKADSILVLLEYGVDVDKSKKLITELEIEKNVVWLAKMDRKDLMAAIYFSDICVGELGYREWYSYSSIMEFMAMKKPLIHHRGDAFYKAKGMDLYPMVDAKNAAEVTATFEDYRHNTNKYVRMGEEANNWILKNADKKLNVFRNLILQKKESNFIPFFFLKKVKYYFSEHIFSSLIYLTLFRLKTVVKRILKR